MKPLNYHLFFGLLLWGSFLVKAQEEGADDLGTQEVTVVKSYSPNLKDVFKIRSLPAAEDTLVYKKQKIEYTFETIPVVSTFIPNKASPLKLNRQERTTGHNSYVSGGIGNNAFLKFDISSMVPLDRIQSIGFKMLRTKVGSIENTLLNSEQNRTTLDLLHQHKQNKMRVDSDLRFDRQGHNFFGLYNFDWNNIPSFRAEVIDPTQNLNYLSIRSNWQWYDAVFRKVNFNTHFTTDSFDSSEYILKINTQILLPFLRNYIELIPKISLINTDFTRGYFSDESLSYQNGLGALDFNFLSIGKKLKLKLGASGFYHFANSDEKAALYAYPNTEISYNFNNSKIIPYLKYEGGFHLNSFTSFSQNNPYVSPTLSIRPTQENNHFTIGLNAFPGSGFSFNINTQYSELDDFPIFKRLPYDKNNGDMAYRLSNAYRVIYDRLQKMGIVTDISIRFSEYNKVSLNLNYFKYRRASGEKAFNLPETTIDISANFRLAKKIFIQTVGKYMGKRDSVKFLIVQPGEEEEGGFESTETTGSVFSISTYLTWKINSAWDLFYENKMLLGDQTSQWAYYQNQDQLHLGGIRYKFDINL